MALYKLLIVISLQGTLLGQELINKNTISIASSSTHDNGDIWYASRAIDGDARRDPGICECCAATNRDWEPWYQVDLGRVYNIHSLEVIGRFNTHSLKNMRVTYGTTSYTETEMFTNTRDEFTISHKLQPSPQPGRYMELKLVQTRQFFVICELNVNKECDNGKYGSGCTSSCGNCSNGAPCDKDTGFCQSCDAGYKGDKCDQECSAGEYGPDCAEACGQCTDSKPCNKFNGSCTECQQGFMEPLCKECIEGFYEDGSICTQCGNCFNGAACDQETGACHSCAAGYKGLRCDQACASGEYGRDCAEKCGRCKDGQQACNKFNGACTECQMDFLIPLCQECRGGRYGENCDLDCGNCLGGRICDTQTGHCPGGCLDGYNGTLCITKCSSGTFGKNCKSACGNCSDNDVCRFDNGNCERGCKPGFKPPTCLEECEDGKYGQNCSVQCGECQNGEACDKSNGTCTKCASNYQAPFCTIRVNSKPPEKIPIGPIIGAVIGVLAVAVIVIAIIYCKRRKNSLQVPKDKLPDTLSGKITEDIPANKTKPLQKPVTTRKNSIRGDEHVAAAISNEDDENSNIYYDFLAKKTELKICQLWDYIILKKKEKCGMFFQEYDQIDNTLKHSHDAAMLPRNRELNRYRGIVAYDHSRVKLQVENESERDYINACFINGYEKPRKFIASQGPTTNMKDDFWRMVWQQKSKFIVMVTNLVEMGKEKCVMYWPEDKGSEVPFGKITVGLVSEDVTSDYTIRHLEIYKGNKGDSLGVTQYHFQAWPDRSTPDSTWSLVKFWRTVTEDVATIDDSGPIVVHCSAGIGRTGTFIAFDVAYSKARTEGTVKVQEVVTTLREQRIGMVQKEEQYVYIHEALADAFLFGTHYIWSNQFEEVYDFLKQPMDGNQTTRLETQFNLIKESIDDKKAIQISTEENGNIYNNVFNKRSMLLSGEDYRPKSKSIKYVQEVGALILPNHEEKETFIISKSPEKSRLTEFWSLVQEQNVKTIISVTPSESANKSSSIAGISDSLITDKFGLTLLEERKTSSYTERKLNLKDQENQDVEITHFEYSDWSTNTNVPKTASSMLQLIEAVMNCQRQFSETEPILVYCKSGFKDCGLVCVLLSEINRMNREGSQINIIHTVKTMKERHDDIIGTYDQYQFVHDVILEHVRDSTYQNQ